MSPQKVAEYKAEQTATQTTTEATKPSVSQASHGASFSSPSSFGQTARPIVPAQASEPVRPAASNSNQSNVSTPGASSPVSAPRASESARFRATPEVSRPATPSAPTSNFNSESNMLNKPNSNERVLTVGNDILLKGEITTCDRLVIEGKVDATVSEVHTMELAAAGTFKGTAEVEYAEISGSFEGNLVVRTSLVIKSSGKVSGNITYGDIEIARGGAITGEIKTISTSQAVSGKKDEKLAA